MRTYAEHDHLARLIRDADLQPVLVALNVKDDAIARQETGARVTCLKFRGGLPIRRHDLPEPRVQRAACVRVLRAEGLDLAPPDDVHPGTFA